MATSVFQAGMLHKAAFAAVGTSTYTDINITGWDHMEEVDDHDVSHTGSAGVQWVIPGLLRASGTVAAKFDIANPNFADPPKIRAGIQGILRLWATDPAAQSPRYFAVPLLIKSVPYKSAVAGTIEFSFTYKLDGATGTYTRP